jgi:hypothetical protein
MDRFLGDVEEVARAGLDYRLASGAGLHAQ